MIICRKLCGILCFLDFQDVGDVQNEEVIEDNLEESPIEASETTQKFPINSDPCSHLNIEAELIFLKQDGWHRESKLHLARRLCSNTCQQR